MFLLISLSCFPFLKLLSHQHWWQVRCALLVVLLCAVLSLSPTSIGDESAKPVLWRWNLLFWSPLPLVLVFQYTKTVYISKKPFTFSISYFDSCRRCYYHGALYLSYLIRHLVLIKTIEAPIGHQWFTHNSGPYHLDQAMHGKYMEYGTNHIIQG